MIGRFVRYNPFGLRVIRGLIMSVRMRSEKERVCMILVGVEEIEVIRRS